MQRTRLFVRFAAITESAGLLKGGKIWRSKAWAAIIWPAMPAITSLSRRLRERKYRKEKPFALMVKDLTVARSVD